MEKIGIKDYLDAGYSHYYVQTDEMGRAIKLLKDELMEYKDKSGKALHTDISEWGVTPPPLPPNATQQERNKQLESWEPNAMAPLIQLEGRKVNSVIILKNYHWFMRDGQGRPDYNIVQFLQDRLVLFRGNNTRRIIIIVAPVPAVDALPREISREFVHLRFTLPSEEEIKEVLDRSISVGQKMPDFEKPSEEDKQKVIDNAMGLSIQEAENAFFFSMVKTKGKILPTIVRDTRMKYLEDQAGIKYIQYKEQFNTLLGYDRIKDILRILIPNLKSKGVLIIGPPGTGKSHIAKACSGEFDIPMITIEMAEWFSKWFGETGDRVRRTIDAILAFKRVIVFVDEIEKGLAGAGSGNSSSGQQAGHEETQRALSQWLKFQQDHPDGIFIIATCNNLWGLPPEYIRAERWDMAPFFVDLPVWEERKMILDFYKKEYVVKGSLTEEDTEGWSGAELKAVCRLANIMNSTIDKTKELIVPISETMKEQIADLRQKCAGRTIRATRSTLSKGWTMDRAVNF